MSASCPIASTEAFRRQLDILRQVKSIAVVGMSPNPARPSHEVGLFLATHGYSIIPIHPAATEIAGHRTFASLTAAVAAGHQIDLVDLFVAGNRSRPIVEEAVGLGLKIVWFQPGAEAAEVEAWAQQQGLTVISRACTMAVLERAAG
jgi:uncharacterized protein